MFGYLFIQHESSLQADTKTFHLLLISFSTPRYDSLKFRKSPRKILQIKLTPLAKL